jgi:O-antigen/teichoic acid export membrane protein
MTALPRRLAGVSPLFRNASLLFASSIVLSGMGALFWLVAARQYPASEVGTGSAVISASLLVSGLAQLGLATILTRYLPSAGSRALRTVLTSYAASAGATLVLAIPAVLTVGLWSPTLAFLGESPGWALLFIVGSVFWSIFSLQDSVLTGLRETRWVPIENTAYSALRLAFVILLASRFPGEGMVLASLVPAALLVLPVNAAIITRFVPRASAGTGGSSWTFADLRRLALGNYAGQAASLVSVFFLPILVADQVGKTEAAYFYVAWTIGVSLALIANTMATSLVVEASFDEARLSHLVRQSNRAVVRIVVPLALVITVGAGPLLSIFGSAYSSHGATLMRLLALSTIPGAVATIGIGIARVHHDGRRVALVQVAVAVVGIALAIALMPRWGIDGVGFAWLVSQVVAACLLIRGLWATSGYRRLGRPAG